MTFEEQLAEARKLNGLDITPVEGPPAPAPVLASALPNRAPAVDVNAAIPPAPAAPPPPAAPAIPSKPILESKTGTSTTEKLSKPQIEDEKRRAEIQAQEVDAQKKLTALNVTDAEKQREADDRAAETAERQAQAKAEAIEQAQQRRAQAEINYQEKFDNYSKMQFHSLLADRSTASNLAIDIGQALGAFGSSRSGRNVASDIINERVRQDFDIQKANIEKAKDAVVMAKAGVADADQARAILLDDLDVKYAATLDAVKKRLVAGKMEQGMKRAQAEGDADVAKIATTFQKMRQETTDKMANRSTSESKFINPEAEAFKAGLKAETKKAGQDLELYDPETGQAIGRARNPRDVTMATKVLESAQKARGAVTALEVFHEAHPGRQLGAFGVGTPEYQELQGLRKDVVNAFASLYGNGGSDVKMKGDALRLPREGDLFAAQDSKRQIKHLNDTIDSVKSGVLRARGIEPTGAPAKPSVETPTGLMTNGAPGGGAPKLRPVTDQGTRVRLKAVLANPKTSADEKQKAQALLDAG